MNNNLMTNAELKIQMQEMENEYEALKVKIKQDIERMEILDKKYIFLKEILNKRTNGTI